MINGGVLPVKLGKVGMMQLDVHWAYLDAGVAVVGTVSTATSTNASTATQASAESASSSAAATKAASAAADSVTSATAVSAKTTTVAAAATASDTASTEATTSTSTAAAAVSTKKTVAARAVDDVTFSANVAVDMFFDADKDLAGLTSNATYEIMVWLAQLGKYTDPIGVDDGIVASQVVEGVNFTLYTGTNDKEQHVLTWIAAEAAPTFNGSILPLITVLSSLDLTHYPMSTDYLGYFAFGSEAYYSDDKVTFEVQELSMDIW